MKQFDYTVVNPFGMHVRPSGVIANQAQEYPNTLITITCGADTMTANNSLKLISMGVKKGSTITMTFDGEFEQDAFETFIDLLPTIL